MLAARRRKAVKLTSSLSKAKRIYGRCIVAKQSAQVMRKFMSEDGHAHRIRMKLRRTGRAVPVSEPLRAQDLFGQESMIGKLAESYHGLLVELGADSQHWGGMRVFGPRACEDLSLSQAMRGMILRAEAGVLKRFVHRFLLRPYRWYVFPDPLRTDEERDLEEAASEEKCDDDQLFVQQLLNFQGGPAGLRTPLGRQALELFFEILLRHTAAAIERFHSMHRHYMLHQGHGKRRLRHLAS